MTLWQLALQALNTHQNGAHKCENEKCNKRFDLPPDGGKNKRFCSEACRLQQKYFRRTATYRERRVT